MYMVHACWSLLQFQVHVYTGHASITRLSLLSLAHNTTQTALIGISLEEVLHNYEELQQRTHTRNIAE